MIQIYSEKFGKDLPRGQIKCNSCSFRLALLLLTTDKVFMGQLAAGYDVGGVLYRL
jgi:hypothetical protein